MELLDEKNVREGRHSGNKRATTNHTLALEELFSPLKEKVFVAVGLCL